MRGLTDDKEDCRSRGQTERRVRREEKRKRRLEGYRGRTLTQKESVRVERGCGWLRDWTCMLCFAGDGSQNFDDHRLRHRLPGLRRGEGKALWVGRWHTPYGSNGTPRVERYRHGLSVRKTGRAWERALGQVPTKLFH